MKTLVIGIDGASWGVMDYLLKKEKIPNISSLIKRGVSGVLESTLPPITPSAWSSMATGVNPGKHGIFDFTILGNKNYQIRPADYSLMSRIAIWDIFNIHNRKVGVINFPNAFPPPKVASFFVSGAFSPEKDYAYPSKIQEYLVRKKYFIHPRFPYQRGREKEFLAEIKKITDLRFEIALELIKFQEWDLFWAVFMGIDWIQHFFWKGGSLEELTDVLEFYQYIDEKIGQLLAGVEKDCRVIIVSDHGMRGIIGQIHTNNLLEEWGYLQKKRQATFDRTINKILPLLDRLPRKLRIGVKQLKDYFLAERWGKINQLINPVYRFSREIDWERTKAFSCGCWGRIYLNLRGKYLQGIVSPARDYFRVREGVVEKLRNLVHPQTGEKIIGEIFFKEDIYKGPYLDYAPDIMFNPKDYKYSIYGDFSKSWFLPAAERRADHDPEGVLIMSGPGIKKGLRLKNKKIVDLFPTLLYLHNFSIPSDIDGEVIREALDEEPIRAY